MGCLVKGSIGSHARLPRLGAGCRHLDLSLGLPGKMGLGKGITLYPGQNPSVLLGMWWGGAKCCRVVKGKESGQSCLSQEGKGWSCYCCCVLCLASITG